MNRLFLALMGLSIVVVLQASICAQTTYFVDAGQGSDANTGKSSSSPWRSIIRVNQTLFSPGDAILLKRGNSWRESLVIPSSGQAGRPITFGAYGIGANPILNGSDLVTNWRKRGSNTWVTGVGGAKPNQLFFNGMRGIKVLSIPEVKSTLQWYCTLDSVYIFSPNDPMAEYSVPGIEMSVREYVIYENTNRFFVAIDGIDAIKANSFGILLSQVGSGDISIRNLTTSQNFNSGIFFTAPNITIRNVRASSNGINSLGHGIYAKGDGFVIADCRADSNAGAGVHAYQSGGGEIKNNTLCGNGTQGSDGWGLVVYSPKQGKSIKVFNNLIYGNLYHGLSVEQAAVADTVSLYHNVLYDNGTTNIGGGISLISNGQGSLVLAKNNICFQNRYCDLFVASPQGTYVLDYNLYYRSTGAMIRVNSTEYSASQYSQYRATTLQDAHSLSDDPHFTNVSHYDFTLQKSSPCIDSGVEVWVSRDIVGVAIPQGSKPDMGPYESPALSTPIIELPRSGETVTSMVNVTWTPTAGAVSYHIQLSMDSLFSRMIADTSVTSNGVQFGPLTYNSDYYVRLQAKGNGGESAFSVRHFFVSSTKVNLNELSAPKDGWKLFQNYPNPFNPSTAIRYFIAQSDRVRLEVFDIVGRFVSVIVDEDQPAGEHVVTFQSSNLSSGLYYYRLHAGPFTKTMAFTVLK